MSTMSGYMRVALYAIMEFSRKRVLKSYCKSKGLDFRKVWRHDKEKEKRKIEAIKNGTWKSRLSTVTYDDDPIPEPMIKSNNLRKKKNSVKKGRFTITTEY
jgi:hypothetical protein